MQFYKVVARPSMVACAQHSGFRGKKIMNTGTATILSSTVMCTSTMTRTWFENVSLGDIVETVCTGKS